jgi:GH18 family chitinase
VNHGDWKLRYDNQAKAPYLLNEAVPSLITFDDATSTRRKTNYVLKQRGMGGVFMWDLSADYDGKSQDLLDAMYSAWQWAK